MDDKRTDWSKVAPITDAELSELCRRLDVLDEHGIRLESFDGLIARLMRAESANAEAR